MCNLHIYTRGKRVQHHLHIGVRLGISADSTGLGCSKLKVDNVIQRINHYPVDSMVCFVNTYQLDSDLSGG